MEGAWSCFCCKPPTRGYLMINEAFAWNADLLLGWGPQRVVF